MKLVYLASPYSHLCDFVMYNREQAVNFYASRLHEMFPEVLFFLPITTSAPMARLNPSLGGDFETWKNRDLYAIDLSAEVWVLTMDGWLESKGVQAEIEYANQTGKEVRYINPTTLEFIEVAQNAIHS